MHPSLAAEPESRRHTNAPQNLNAVHTEVDKDHVPVSAMSICVRQGSSSLPATEPAKSCVFCSDMVQRSESLVSQWALHKMFPDASVYLMSVCPFPSGRLPKQHCCWCFHLPQPAFRTLLLKMVTQSIFITKLLLRWLSQSLHIGQKCLFWG